MPTPLQPDNSYSTLTKIQQKARRLAQALDTNALTDNQLNEYINTFVLYDFPEHLRLFTLQETLTFYTAPYIESYSTNTEDPTSPLYNFKNKYITVNPPVYVAGYQVAFSQSRSSFYANWPNINSIIQIGAGNDVTSSYSGNINFYSSGNNSSLSYNVNNQSTFLLQNNVTFSAIESSTGLPTDGGPLVMTDYPISAVMGNLRIPNQDPTSTVVQDLNNYINYQTGEFKVTFSGFPASGTPVNAQVVMLNAAMPQSVLFYGSSFTMRPVPDQAYPVNIEVFRRPDQLLDGNMPELSEWWQLIAAGAAKKVCEDRADMETVNNVIMPVFKEQMDLINRRTLVQQSNQRAATIYSEQTNIGAGYYGPNSGNGQI